MYKPSEYVLSSPTGLSHTCVHVLNPQGIDRAVKHDPLLVGTRVLQGARSRDDCVCLICPGCNPMSLCVSHQLSPIDATHVRIHLGSYNRHMYRYTCHCATRPFVELSPQTNTIEKLTSAASLMQHASTPSVHSCVMSSNWPYSWPMVMDLGFSTQVRTWSGHGGGAG